MDTDLTLLRPGAQCVMVSASRNGVLISGAWPIMNEEGIETVKNTLDLAVIGYHLLKKR